MSFGREQETLTHSVNKREENMKQTDKSNKQEIQKKTPKTEKVEKTKEIKVQKTESVEKANKTKIQKTTKNVEIAIPYDFKIDIHPHKTQLPHEIWYIPSDRPIVSVSITFRGAGSRNFNQTHPSLRNFFPEMLAKGAGKYDGYEFAGKLIDCGGFISGDMYVDDADFNIWVPFDGYKKVFDLAILSLTAPKLPSKFFRKMRQESLISIEESLKNPRILLNEAVTDQLFPKNHPYYSSLQQEKMDLKKFSPKDLRAYLKCFAQSNAVVVVLGPREKEQEIIQQLEKMLLKLPKTSAIKQMPKHLKTPQDHHIPFDIPQTVITGLHPGYRLDDPNQFAKNVAMHILAGGGLNARLFSEIRKKRGLAYAVYGTCIHTDLIDYLKFSIGTRNETALEAMKILKKILEDVRKHGVTKKEFDLAKKEFLGSLVVGLDSSGKFLAHIASLRSKGESIQQIQDRMERYRKLTHKEVNQACLEMFDPDKLVCVDIGNYQTDTDNNKQQKESV